MVRTHGSTRRWLIFAAALALAVVACSKPKTAQAPRKSEANIRRAWDGTAAVILPDGRRFVLASPLLWIFHGDTNVLDPSEDPLTERCLLLARGVPYLRNPDELMYGFEPASDNWPRAAVERRDLCAQAFGSAWRLPAIEELGVIAPQLAASAGSQFQLIAYARDQRGRIRVFRYVVPGCFLEGPCDSKPQVRVTDSNGAQVVCLGPNDAPADHPPNVNELRNCAQRFALFLETSYRIPHRTIDPELIDLANAVHAACKAGSDLERWRELSDRLGRELRQPLSESALSTEAAYLEQRLTTLDEAAHHPVQRKANNTDCQALPELYQRKCGLGTGNTSCIALQLKYAVRCNGLHPDARIEAVRNELTERLQQVRRSRRRVATLALATRKAHRCLAMSTAAHSAEQRRLAEQLASFDGASAPAFGVMTPHYCTCALADLECGFDSLRKPEACPTERPTQKPR